MQSNVRKIDWEDVCVELADSIDTAKAENITLIRLNPTTRETWRISPNGNIEYYNIALAA